MKLSNWQLIEKLKERQEKLASVLDEIATIKLHIVENSELKIGDKVLRINKKDDKEYFVSRIWFDDEDLVLRYGIKSDMSNKIDTYSCFKPDSLLRVLS